MENVDIVRRFYYLATHPKANIATKRRCIVNIQMINWDKVIIPEEERFQMLEHIEALRKQIGDKRKPIRIDLRFKIFLRDKFTCQYCGAKAPEVQLEIDHIQPNIKAGADEIDNYTTACKTCNLGKKDLWNEELNQFRAEKMNQNKTALKDNKMTEDLNINKDKVL